MYNKNKLKEVFFIYENISENIILKLNEFKKNFNSGNKKDIFSELAFCILTPQSKVRSCWSAIEALKFKRLLFSGEENNIAEILRGKVRFHNTKAGNLCRAREFFINTLQHYLKYLIKQKDIKEVRKYLVENIKGIGFKESSHFLRNIGFGEEIAILDRHILKKLFEISVVLTIPKSISEKKYLEIEDNMRLFSNDINIPLSHLDLLLWYMATGEIFK